MSSEGGGGAANGAARAAREARQAAFRRHRVALASSGDVASSSSGDVVVAAPASRRMAEFRFARLSGREVTLVSTDGTEFRVCEEAAFLSEWVSDHVVRTEEWLIELQMDREVLAKIVSWMEQDIENNFGRPEEKRVVFQFSIERELIGRVLIAADFLQVPGLYATALHVAAMNVDDTHPLTSFPPKFWNRIQAYINQKTKESKRASVAEQKRRSARHARSQGLRDHIRSSGSNKVESDSKFDVVVTAGPPPPRSAASPPGLSGREVTLVSCDGVSFSVCEEAAFLSDWIRHIFSAGADGERTWREQEQRRVELELIDSNSLEQVCQYMTTEIETNWGKPEKTVFQFGIPVGELANVLQASHFLQLPSLMELSCTMLAHNIEDVEDLEDLPVDLWELIFPRISVRSMCKLDERGDFRSLSLERLKMAFWSRHRSEIASSREGGFDLELTETFGASDADTVFQKRPEPMSADVKAEAVAMYLQRACDSAMTFEEADEAWTCLEELGTLVLSGHAMQLPLHRRSLRGSLTGYVAALPNLVHLEVVGWLSPEEQLELATAIADNCTRLTKLTMRRMGLNGEEAAEIARICSKIRTLDFSGNVIGNLELLGEALSETATTELVLTSQDTPLSVLEALCPPLQKVSFADCPLPPKADWEKILANVPTLQVLDLAETRLGWKQLLWDDDASLSFCTGLMLSQIRHLNLSGSLWSNQNVECLARHLPPSLHTLNVSGCSMASDAIQALAQACVSMGTLRHVDCSDNNLGGAIFTQFVRIVEVPGEDNRCALESLKMARCRLDDAATDAVLSLHRRFPYMLLDVRDNIFSEGHIARLSRATAENDQEESSADDGSLGLQPSIMAHWRTGIRPSGLLWF